MKNRILRQCLAWTLIALTANPLAITAAYGRDSDIYLSVTSGTATAEPNILMILDTSDSMNIPEPWREYPGEYDSHVEYLWNDTTFVTSSISTAAPTVLAAAGSWAGATLPDRQALRTSAINYAAATEPGDPGNRNTYRNYNDAAWVYWLEAGAAETDARLRSPSFNRWRGHINAIGGTRGGIGYTGTTDFRANNKCRDSGSPPETSLGHAIAAVTQFGTGTSSQFDPARPTVLQGLTPSTVYAPSAAPRNSGRYLDTVWRRWNPFDKLRTGRLTNSDTGYSMTSGAALAAGSGGDWIDWRAATPPVPTATGAEDCNAASGIYCRRISAPGSTIGFGNDNARIRALNEFLAGGGISGTNVRDSWPAPPNHADGIWYLGYVGQPVRVQVDKGTRGIVDDGDDSRSRWARLNADLGGFVFADTVRFMNATVLTNVLAPYNAQVAIPAGSPQNRAWLGNRTVSNSSGSNWHSIVGTPAYVNSQVTEARILGGALSTVEFKSDQGANGFAVGNWINIPTAGIAGAAHIAQITVLNTNVSFTISPAAPQASTSWQQVTRNLRLVTIGTASVNRCQVSYTLDADPGVAGNQAAFAATSNNDAANRVITYVKNPVAGACKAGVATLAGPGNDCTGVVPTNKAPSGASNYITARYSGCGWSGRQSLYVEGVGTYYYGGTCGAASSCRGAGFVLGAASCAAAGSPTTTFGSSSYQVNNNCTVSGLTNLTVGGTSMAGAVLNNATSGCGNKGDVFAACNPREGTAIANPCTYYASPTCPTDTWTTTPTTSTTDYQVFENINRTSELVHDCQADDGTVGNPGSGYLADVQDRLFATAWNAAANLTANSTAPYRTTATNTFAGNPARSDQYSVNYLNWRFGPKGPNGNPIGRKTRLQIAKDALTGLVATTDGVRFGLMVFNRTAGCTSSVGSIDIATNASLMLLSDNPGFAIGQTVSITGAGLAGATYITTITDIQPDNTYDPPKTTLTLALAALTSINDQQIAASPCTGSVGNEGANVAQRIQRMGSNNTDLPDFNNRAALNVAVNAVVAAARTPLTESLYEAYRYYSGRTPRFGTLTASALIGGTVTQGRDTLAVCPGAVAGCPYGAGFYRSPMLNNPNTTTPAGCQKNFVILLTDGGPEDDWSANADIKRLQHAGVLGTVATRTTIDANSLDTPTDQFETSGVRYGPVDLGGTANDGGYIWLDELAYFLSVADVSPGARNTLTDTTTDQIAGRQSVVTYTIGFAGGNSPVLSNAAVKSGATYVVAEDSQTLRDALTAAITAIRDWNPTAASPTVPISALNRSENATDVYLAFFQPDPTSAWKGTVKRYQLSQSETDCGTGIGLCLIGQSILTKAAPNPSPAKNIETIDVDPVTNTQQVVVDPNAVSFWGPNTLTDGSAPDNGGTGYQLINTAGYNPSTRNVYTFLSGVSGSTNLADPGNRFNESHTGITKTMLGNAGMTDAARATLINFALGGDAGTAACSDASTGTACTAWRAWPHFDVQHSKPAVITYDISTSPVVQVMYYLGNNGMLHAVNTITGQELWTFLLEEAITKIPGLMADISGPQLDAGDGSISVFQEDLNNDGIVNGADRAWIYFGLRRGGRAMYALDVTNRLAPQFKWKITAESGSGQLCSGLSACAGAAAYNELGQTWSIPTVGRIRALGTTTPAVIFGGGYDVQEDAVPPATSANTMGRAVYVVNGETGTVVSWFGTGGPGTLLSGAMSYAIPSDVTAINSDLDAQNYLDRIYVGDMGGNVWRFDINDVVPGNWQGKLLATLSAAAGPKRKLFFPPAAVKQINPERFDAVYIGSGDREHPRLTTTTTPATTTDVFAMIMDRDVGLAMSGASTASLVGGDFIQIANSNLTGVVLGDLTTKKGWYRDLDDGEKVVNSPTVFFQRLRFGTYAPLSQTNACTPPGEGRLNEIDALSAGLFNLNAADGLTPTDRYYSGFITRGYVSTGQIVVIGKNVYHIVVSDARLKANLVGSIGNATKIYWYMEPEQ